MLSYKQFRESIIKPSDDPDVMSFWHGGNLENSYSDSISHKKGRWEYGPGLYLTTHHGTAQKYSKGSRKLYIIDVEKGKDANKADIAYDKILEFVNDYIVKSKRKEVINRLNKYNKEDKVSAYIFINIIVNEDAIKATNTNELRNFLVKNGVDYMTVSNAFGWGELMLVLFNMKKIVKKQIVNPKDEIEEFDLPIKWK